MDHLYIGSSPTNESCAQLGTEGYPERARKECWALIGQLVRLFGEPPPGARLSIKGCPHDFGTYYEVICSFDPADPEALQYACRCEDGLPEYWDEPARAEVCCPR